MSSHKSGMYHDDEHPEYLDPSQYEVSEPQPELKFFMISDPAEAKTPGNKKLVRSHVARTSHAKSRHARSSGRESKAAGSSAQGAMAGMQSGYHTSTEHSRVDPSSSGMYQTYSNPQPSSSFGSTSYGYQGPPASFGGQLSQWDQYLLDYCK